MTLLLTELTPFGIVMAADSAQTQEVTNSDRSVTYRVLTGVVKLQVIPKLRAGISMWGLGWIPVLGMPPTDVWLKNFIANQSEHYNTIAEFATLLQDELRQCIAPIDIGDANNVLGTIGFHLAGYVDYDGHPSPTLYHIHNGVSTALASRNIEIDPTIVNANHDLPPNIVQEGFARGEGFLHRNGDWTTYAQFFNHVGTFLDGLSEQRGIRIPDSRNLKERAEWLRFQIRTMSELYRLSNFHLPKIGGKIDTVLITPNNIDDCGLTF